MRILRIVKFASLGVLLTALAVAGVTLSQSVRTRGNYTSIDPSYAASEKTETSPADSSSSGASPEASSPSAGTSSSKDESSPQTLVLQTYDFSHAKIGIPKESVSLLTVEKSNDAYNTYNVMLRVYEKESKRQAEKDLDESMGLLFEIGCVSTSNYDRFMESGYYESEFFAKSDTRYYVYTEPTDDQFYRSNSTASDRETWQKLQKLGEEVKDIFLNINGVESYVADAWREDSSANSDDHSTEQTNPAGTSPAPAQKDCAACEGSGFCSHCLYGDCPTCYGQGKKDCTSCLGRGRCWSCGGSGYTYKGTGLNFRKADCSRCNAGDCPICDGEGSSDCYSCIDGNCNICDGTADCIYCDGTGKTL